MGCAHRASTETFDEAHFTPSIARLPVKAIVALLALSIIARPLAAQSAAAKASPDTISPSHLAAAREMLDANQTEKGIQEGMRAYFDMHAQQNPLMAPYRATMEEFARKYLVWSDLEPKLAHLYAETLTEDQLRAATAFLRTPAGQALTAHQGDLQRAMMRITQEQLQAHTGELQQMMQARSAELKGDTPKKPE
jgi:hypothetical protein